MKNIDISQLMAVTGIHHSGFISVNSEMSGLEEDPKDDWLYLGLKSFKVLSDEGFSPKTAAIIGCANGIDAIAVLTLFPKLEKLFVTDILPDILPVIKQNIESNIPNNKTAMHYVCGRDCQPVPEKVDLIYGNLPLVMVDETEIGAERSTTTLTDAKHYKPLQENAQDHLDAYSLLSQLGFILSAKTKMNAGGALITLIGGRIPTPIIDEVFSRAQVNSRKLFTSFMKQSDPEFLEQYAKIENSKKANFMFYEYQAAVDLIKNRWGVEVPDILDKSEDDIRALLKPTLVNAQQAFELYKQGKDVGHLAYAFYVTQL